MQVILTELHTQSWIARLKSTLIGWRWGVTSRGIACNLLEFEMALKTAHGFSLALFLINMIVIWFSCIIIHLICRSFHESLLKTGPDQSAPIVDDINDSWKCIFHIMTGTRSVVLCFWYILTVVEANLEEESLFSAAKFNGNIIFTFHYQHRLIAALKRPTSITSLWTSLDLLYSNN